MPETSNPVSSVQDRASARERLPVIDMAVIDELRNVGGNRELLDRVLALFSAHVPKSVARVRQLSADGNLDEMADAVHALKSMCGNIGARRASALCEEIEHLVRRRCAFDRAYSTELLIREIDAVLSAAESLKSH
jgi:HPt (histidine-containing phosphotransfer) domain-containing protein